MTTINKIKNLYKARFGAFTDTEFDELCKAYDTGGMYRVSPEKRNAECVLKTFFANKTPSSEQLKIIYGCDDTLKWLYLASISKKRRLSNDEQLYMAEFMEFGPVFRFPQELNEAALERLFESDNTRRISTYVRSFSLPEHYELELINRYALQKSNGESETWQKGGYGRALELYLESTVSKKCVSANVQNKLLEVADEKMWAKLCSSQSMTVNVLEKNTIRELIAKNYTEAVRELLAHSFIPTRELQRYLLCAMPQFKWELEISKVRHALRKMELETGKFWGVEAPDFYEMKLIDVSILNDDKADYAEYSVRPRLTSGFATPYFCAWAANFYSELGEDAYICLRNFAEKQKRNIENS